MNIIEYLELWVLVKMFLFFLFKICFVLNILDVIDVLFGNLILELI